MKQKRKKPEMVKHLWHVLVRHRDYVATENDRYRGNTLIMTETTLYIVSPQRPMERENIDKGLAVARRFLNRNRREYAIPNIKSVAYQGTIDN